MNNKSIILGLSTAIAGAAVIKSMRGNNKRKVKKAINRAFNTVNDTVQNMR